MYDDTFLTALTGRFDVHEEQLRHVALRMTGSPAEAEEALAAARADLGRDDGASVRVWLTALVAQECVRVLQERQAGGGPGRRRTAGEASGAAAGAGLEAAWLALFFVLESLEVEERLAYVLHDVFGLPPYETARITGGSPEEVARLARRARERVRGQGAARTEGARGGSGRWWTGSWPPHARVTPASSRPSSTRT